MLWDRMQPRLGAASSNNPATADNCSAMVQDTMLDLHVCTTLTELSLEGGHSLQLSHGGGRARFYQDFCLLRYLVTLGTTW
jgi:hypothetical protein